VTALHTLDVFKKDQAAAMIAVKNFHLMAG
jgi:hypothetical protein